ncbi:hypothetical protein, partial [Permianibacter aggregans]
GMKTEELFNDGDVDEEKKKIYYRVMIRGAMDAGNPLRGNFTDWQAKAKMNPELYQRKADHLRPGENLRIILINRQTGYIGSLTTPLKNINEGGYGAISFPIAEIKMLPPNLSVRVERRTTVEHGLTKDEERHYQVGYEGGATANDNVIEIFTEWYEQDGRPLPEELGEYGYTGRLAKIVAENELAPEGGDLANFTIKPGKNRQVIRVKDEAITREHYYVHVHAESKNNNPDFATLGAGEGKLQYRPAHYVPFKVAVFDEKATIISRNAWRRAREQGQVEGRFPLPVYRWLYRPEMQFSLFELEMQRITRVVDEEGNISIQVLNSDRPELSAGDNAVELLFNLLANDTAPLPLLGAEREIILSLGGAEIEIAIGSDQQVRFTSLTQLNQVDLHDYMVIALYLNHDPENLLWEFAFGLADIDVDSDNNDGFNEPTLTTEEDKVEWRKPKEAPPPENIGDTTHLKNPGKRSPSAAGDLDEDQIPVFAEFIQIDQSGDVGVDEAASFIPVVLRFPAQLDPEKVQLMIKYEASDPKELKKLSKDTDHIKSEKDLPRDLYVMPSSEGRMRIWKKNVKAIRSRESVKDGGDFVPHKILFTPASIGFVKETDGQKMYKATVYLETLATSKLAADAEIIFEVREFQ